MNTTKLAPQRPEHIILGEREITITGPDKKVVYGLATFYYNHQRTGSVWLEMPSDQPTWPVRTTVNVSANGLKPFEAFCTGTHVRQSTGALTITERFEPSREPVESAKASDLKQLVFALLDCPWPNGDLQQPAGSPMRPFAFQCANFDVALSDPAPAHQAVKHDLGFIPRAVTHTGTLRQRDGGTFESEAG